MKAFQIQVFPLLDSFLMIHTFNTFELNLEAVHSVLQWGAWCIPCFAAWRSASGKGTFVPCEINPDFLNVPKWTCTSYVVETSLNRTKRLGIFLNRTNRIEAKKGNRIQVVWLALILPLPNLNLPLARPDLQTISPPPHLFQSRSASLAPPH